ncbi:insulinase family protein [Demequina aestuarii]|uniref:insulinase family protein n=1 Tax=Demequina aestuarii TaxID=327095 RepID=UPI0007850A49|nr:insulinase family protein [Demequina aestuarii]
MTAPEIVVEDHHGIPLLWADIRATYAGSLTFGVGVIDETARTAGLSHLVEHLVMSRVGQVSISHHALTTEDRTSFYAQGPSALMKDFLHRASAAVSSLTELSDAEVTAQHDIIAAELGEGFQRTGHGPLLERYGAASLGLLDLGSPALTTLTKDQVMAWATAWFQRDNAVLTFTGPPPGGLNVTLPGGDARPAREQIIPLEHRVHGWIAGGKEPLAITLDFTSPCRLARFAARWIISERLRRVLRTERHLIYSVDGLVARVSHDTTTTVMVLDPPKHHIMAAAQDALTELRALADEGPTSDEWQSLIDESRNIEEDSEVLSAALVDAGVDLIRDGEPATSIDHREFESIARDDVRAIIAASITTMVLSVGDVDPDLSPEQITDHFALPWARGPLGHYEAMSAKALFTAFVTPAVSVYSPKPFTGRRGQQLILDSERIAWAVPQVGIMEARWSDIVLAGTCAQCGMWDLTTHTGDGMLVQPADWRGRAKIKEMVASRVPEDLQYAVRHADWH